MFKFNRVGVIFIEIGELCPLNHSTKKKHRCRNLPAQNITVVPTGNTLATKSGRHIGLPADCRITLPQTNSHSNTLFSYSEASELLPNRVVYSTDRRVGTGAHTKSKSEIFNCSCARGSESWHHRAIKIQVGDDFKNVRTVMPTLRLLRYLHEDSRSDGYANTCGTVWWECLDNNK